jgi:hypothetical protein
MTSPDMTRFPTAAGGTADLTRYPIGSRHEDFAMLVEAPGSELGWTAVTRPTGDVALFLKDATRLPVTLLWFSNGGRDYPPWNGRHLGVLGVEDGCTYSLHGHAASIADNPLAREGVPTAITLDPDGEVDVRHVIGASSLPSDFGTVRSVRAGAGVLQIEGEGARTIDLPFDCDFLGKEG